MKHSITVLLGLSVALFLSYSCQQEDGVSPNLGRVTFSHTKNLGSNGRTAEAALPKFVLLSVKDSNGLEQVNLKLSLFAFGQGYVSETLELKTGSYQLLQYEVLDGDDNVILATPVEGSDLARYVSDPLPIQFDVSAEWHQVVPQVLTVAKNDMPEMWGYESFGYEIVNTYRVKQVVLDGIGVQDSLNFSYTNGKVSSIDWCTHVSGNSDCQNEYTEVRHFDDQGNLNEITGRWHVFYFFENGLRKKTMTYRDSLYFSSTNVEYSGTALSRVRVHFADSGVNQLSNIDLTFNSAGDIVHKVVRDREGTLLEDEAIEYTTIENPLRGLQETISYAISFFDFDDFVFYHSKHVPRSITNPVADMPGRPVVHHSIQYECKQDGSGRLISASAFYKGINVHNILIIYDR